MITVQTFAIAGVTILKSRMILRQPIQAMIEGDQEEGDIDGLHPGVGDTGLNQLKR